MTAVEIRCRELADATIVAVERLGFVTLAEARPTLHDRVATLLVEIATGATTLVPNKRQVAEAKQATAQG